MSVILKTDPGRHLRAFPGRQVLLQSTSKRFLALPVLALLLAASSAWTQIHVPADHPTIQGAIVAASNGDEIIVAPGTYNEAIDFDGKAIHLRSSDGPEATIIDATELNTSVVRCENMEGPDTILEGFTITGGNASDGGGMMNFKSSPTVVNCVFQNNSASFFGAGMHNGNGSNPTVMDSVFENNSAGFTGGGMYNNLNSNPTVIGSVFKSNSALGGGGMHNLNNSNPTVTDCSFEDNSAGAGGGMQNVFSNPTITNSVFNGNSTTSTTGGGMNNRSSSPTVTDSLFENNSANLFGGGIHNSEASNPTITNCVFANNSAPIGGGIHTIIGMPEIADSFFCGNDPDDIVGSWDDLGGNEFEEVCAPLPDRPEVTMTTHPATLWPPDHTLRDVQVIITPSGGCDDPGALCDLVLVLLTSSEPDNARGAGDGNTTGDSHGQDGYISPVDITDEFSWYPDHGDRGAWMATIQLRAERAGSGNGRVYSIDAALENNLSESALGSSTVVVPKNQAQRRGPN